MQTNKPKLRIVEVLCASCQKPILPGERSKCIHCGQPIHKGPEGGLPSDCCKYMVDRKQSLQPDDSLILENWCAGCFDAFLHANPSGIGKTYVPYPKFIEWLQIISSQGMDPIEKEVRQAEQAPAYDEW